MILVWTSSKVPAKLKTRKDQKKKHLLQIGFLGYYTTLFFFITLSVLHFLIITIIIILLF